MSDDPIEMMAANDNDTDTVFVGSGDIFVDLGFDREDAERATAALREFYAKGGRRFEDFKSELDHALQTQEKGNG